MPEKAIQIKLMSVHDDAMTLYFLQVDLASFHVAVSLNKTEDAKLLTTKEKYDGNSALSTALEKSVKDVLTLLDVDNGNILKTLSI